MGSAIARNSASDLEKESWSVFDLEGNIVDFLKWIILPGENRSSVMEVDLSSEFAGIPWEINLTRTVTHVDLRTPEARDLEEAFSDLLEDPGGPKGLGTLECALLSVFGTVVSLFFCVQLVVYVRYCSARRKSWQVEPDKPETPCLENGTSTLGQDTDATSWAHMYGPFNSVPYRNGLKFTRSRPGGVLYLSDFDSDSPSEGSGRKGNNTIGSRSTFSSTLYMMDHRGHFSPHEVTVTSPEVAMELIEASRVSSRGSLRSIGQMAPPIPERNASYNASVAVRTPLAIPLLCENPAYESDASPARSSTTSYSHSVGSSAGSTSPLRTIPDSPSPTSPMTLDPSDESSSFTSVSSLSDLSAPALLGLYWKQKSENGRDPEESMHAPRRTGRTPMKSVSFSGYQKHQPLCHRVSAAANHANIYKCRTGARR